MSGAEALLAGTIVAVLGLASITLARIRDGRLAARQLERVGSARGPNDRETESGQ